MNTLLRFGVSGILAIMIKMLVFITLDELLAVSPVRPRYQPFVLIKFRVFTSAN